MDKTEEREAKLERLKKFTVGLLRKEFQDIIPLCDDKMIWKVNERYGNMEGLSEAYSLISKGCLFWNLRDVSFCDFQMIPLRDKVMLISGRARVEWRDEINAVNDCYSFLEESEVLYIKVSHNHVISKDNS